MCGLSFFILILLLCTISPPKLLATGARDVLAPGQAITGNQTLVSAGGTFVLGFFDSRSESFGRKNRFLGIWYKKIPKRTVVWVANRDHPVTDSAAFLMMTEDKNIAVVDSNRSFVWSSDLAGIANGTVAMLLESGNLVLRQGNGQDVWQSFDHPTDTILPEMKLRYNEKTGLAQRVIAWREVDDPSSGDFSVGAIYHQIVIWRRSETYLRISQQSVLGLQVSSTSGVQCVVWVSRVGDEFSFSFFTVGRTAPARWALEASGELKMMVWVEAWSEWHPLWIRPSRFCDAYNLCGPSGACDCNAKPPTCICLHGFVPKNQTEWETRTFSSGCVRRVQLQCSKSDKFLPVKRAKLPDRSRMIDKKTELDCRADCISKCQCTAYAYTNTSLDSDGFMCLIWFGDLVDLEIENTGWENLNIRLVASEFDENQNPMKFLLPVLAIGALLVGAGSYFLVKRLRSRARKRTPMKTMILEDIDLSDTFGSDKGFSEVPLVEFNSVQCATGDFSDANKLGEGGFGSVYKGKLGNGHEIAVKRLSRGSKQGHHEFANEVRLIARLQHKNLVRLLGWCTDQDEKILIYEYMPNKSLDKLVFARSVELSWEKRLTIIMGIADGLLYLHHHSRMRVIHRDLKTSNILLDNEMNPKISDFGLARIFEINQTEGNTRKVVGTFGYMSPEYAIDGVFSEKSDVFSFGVIVLEVISGKRCTGYYPCRESLNLLGYAWQLWKEGRGMELLDRAIKRSFQADEVLKCIQVGLLCIEENPADRPTMNFVVSMLTSENCALPLPKQPGFSFGRNLRVRADRSPRSSIYGLSESTLEGR
ncbi:unnamed protein product [Spirodela intermedia]|uniref:Receptor-like serine/threonine-protein kinase n=2 Tax=Spirodela intermedia TaxID=51605 RepID=A0A7I8KAE8_SPIIN|nr:unnamed protein product [Spirodela intermedia]